MVEIGPKYTPSLSIMTLLIIPQSPSPPSPKTQLTFFFDRKNNDTSIPRPQVPTPQKPFVKVPC